MINHCFWGAQFFYNVFDRFNHLKSIVAHCLSALQDGQRIELLGEMRLFFPSRGPDHFGCQSDYRIEQWGHDAGKNPCDLHGYNPTLLRSAFFVVL